MPDVWGKLNLKNQKEIVVVNAPPSFEPEIAALDGVTVKRKPAGVTQIAFFLGFVTTKKEVDALSAIVAERTVPDAVVWMVAIDEDWTGKRFRRVAFIKNLTRDPRALVSKEAKKRVSR